MNKNGLIAEVSKRTGASKADTGRAIDAAMDVIREAVAKKLSNGHVNSPTALRSTDNIVCTAYANSVYPIRLALRICRSASVMTLY